jgi:hypothetical protein
MRPPYSLLRTSYPHTHKGKIKGTTATQPFRKEESFICLRERNPGLGVWIQFDMTAAILRHNHYDSPSCLNWLSLQTISR